MTNWDTHCVVVVGASDGYPGQYVKGKTIEIPEADCDDRWIVQVLSGRNPAAQLEGYIGHATGPRGWRRYELEVTSAVAGRTVIIAIGPGPAGRSVGLRNVVVSRAAEPGAGK